MIKNFEKTRKSSNGITLIALVITIIIILILSGISIGMLSGENSIINQAGNTKEKSKIAEEKEIIEVSSLKAMGKNKYGSLVEDEFQQQLNKNAPSSVRTEIVEADDNGYIVKFFEDNGTTRYYNIDENGHTEYIDGVIKEKKLKIQCINSKNTILAEYEYTILKDRYSKTPPIVNGYEASVQKIEDDITEDETIQVLYYLICKDDSTLVFNLQNDEYTLGVSGSYGSGLKEEFRELEYILEVPEWYNGKKVSKVETFAFARTNLIKVSLSDNITTLAVNSFMDCKKLNYIKFGNQISSMKGGGGIFNRCTSLTKDSFKLSKNNTSFQIVDGVLYSYDLKTLILYPAGESGNYEIPNNVNTLGKCCFSGSYIKSVYIPKSVTTWQGTEFQGSSLTKVEIQSNIIGSLCWRNCNISDVTIGTNMNTIKTNAFIDNSKLESIKYEGTMQQWNAINKETTWHNRCNNLKKIVCSDGEITL